MSVWDFWWAMPEADFRTLLLAIFGWLVFMIFWAAMAGHK